MGVSVSGSDHPSVIKSAPEQQPTTVELIAKYFPADQVSTAEKIMYLESGGIPTKHFYSTVTGDDSWGLYQINRYGSLAITRPSPDWLINPENNIAYAARLYKSQGWCSPWYNSSHKIGVCK